MLPFVIVVTHDPREVFLWLFRPCFVGGGISPSSKRTRVRVFLLTLHFSKPLFGLFPGLFGGLYISERAICGLRILSFWFRLLNSRILHCSALGLYLGRGDVGKMVSLQSLMVYLTDVKSGLEAYFGLSFDRFLDYFFPGIQFSALLFRLGLYGRLKAFSKKSNKVGLFWSPVNIKL